MLSQFEIDINFEQKVSGISAVEKASFVIWTDSELCYISFVYICLYSGAYDDILKKTLCRVVFLLRCYSKFKMNNREIVDGLNMIFFAVTKWIFVIQFNACGHLTLFIMGISENSGNSYDVVWFIVFHKINNKMPWFTEFPWKNLRFIIIGCESFAHKLDVSNIDEGQMILMTKLIIAHLKIQHK